MNEEARASFINNSNYNPEDYNNASDEMPTTGADNGLTLADLRGVDYDDLQWDDLLDQLTVDDMSEMIAIGGFGSAAADSVGKVSTTDCDGPASINNNFTGVGSIGFPSATMIACTWNKEKALEFGQNIGAMADEMGVSGWYAPATNTHRTPFGGRNFEYYSEDGVLAGYMAANAEKGAWEYAGDNADPSMETWKIILIVTDIILVAGLILLETLAVRKYLKRKSHTAIKVETDKQNMDA